MSPGAWTGLWTTRGAGCWHPITAVPRTSGKGPRSRSPSERVGAGCRGTGVCFTGTAWAAFLGRAPALMSVEPMLLGPAV